MRAPFALLPLALALAAPLATAAEDGPKVLFCSGNCYAVDAGGVRTPAPKGTPLLPGQRLETGRGSYAQVKMGDGNAFGVGENARVKLERNGVFLDEGRIRMIGSATARPIELRTDDTAFDLRGADIELKKSGRSSAASPLLVKLNAGEARVSGESLTNGGVQLVTAGGVMPGAPLPSTELAASALPAPGPVAQAGGVPSRSVLTQMTPVRLRPIPAPPPSKTPPVVRPPVLVLPPMAKQVRPPEPPPLPLSTRLLSAPVVNTTTGEILTLNTALILTVQPTYSYTTISPTLISPTLTTTSTTTLTSPTLSTTSLTSTPILTTTKYPTTSTTTSTTTFNLLTSPTLSTTTLSTSTLLIK